MMTIEQKSSGIARVGVVQFAYTPLSLGPASSWMPAEPLAPEYPLAKQDDLAENYLDVMLGSLSPKEANVHADWIENTLSANWTKYIENVKSRLSRIMAFAGHHSVDIVVFPEYSMPPKVLAELAIAFPRQIIVAGLAARGESPLAP